MKQYYKPEIVEYGDIHEFIQGVGSGNYADTYSSTNNCIQDAITCNNNKDYENLNCYFLPGENRWLINSVKITAGQPCP